MGIWNECTVNCKYPYCYCIYRLCIIYDQLTLYIFRIANCVSILTVKFNAISYTMLNISEGFKDLNSSNCKKHLRYFNYCSDLYIKVWDYRIEQFLINSMHEQKDSGDIRGILQGATFIKLISFSSLISSDASCNVVLLLYYFSAAFPAVLLPPSLVFSCLILFLFCLFRFIFHLFVLPKSDTMKVPMTKLKFRGRTVIIYEPLFIKIWWWEPFEL